MESAPKSKNNGKNRNIKPCIDRNHLIAEDIGTSSSTIIVEEVLSEREEGEVMKQRTQTCAV